MFTQEELASTLQRHMEQNSLTQAQAAKELEVSQTFISRILNRGWTRRSARIVKIGEVLGARTPADPRKNDDLMNALAEVWSGDPDDAKALAKCILAIGEARKHSVR